MLMFSGIVFVFLIVTMLIIAGVNIILVKQGVFRFGESTFSTENFIFYLAICSVIFGTALSFITGRFLLKPLNSFINAMNRLASGDFKTRVGFRKPFGKIPAVAETTGSFNNMAKELENTEMLRSDFINNFSHEFKTPIVSIAGFAKLLKRGNLTDSQKEEYIGIIEEESMRLSYMATNVLNLTKVENQTILTDVTEFNLSEQIRNSVLLLEPRLSKKNVDLQIDFKLREHYISANEELLKQVWINLIDNASKFVNEYGTVSIDLSRDDSTTSVTVSNTGSEIPENVRDRIFNKFYQAEESHSAEGNGVGLAIVKQIVKLHGGTVSVESGDGITSFTVTLPNSQ